MPRWSWLLLLAAGAAGCDGCTGREPPAPAAHAAERIVPSAAVSAPPGELSPPAPRELTWTFDSTPVGRMRVVLSLPAAGDPSEPPPVLIAFHGRGEAFKGVDRGARGWIDDYWLPRAAVRLAAPPLLSEDFMGFVAPDRLAEINAELGRRPYRGLIVACPYTPDILAGTRAFALAEPLSAFVVDELLPRIQRELGAGGVPDRVGIDGVSLGGRAALLVGFLRPEAFGVVGSVQAAFDAAEVAELTRRARAAQAKNPKLQLRLLTSEGDFFREALTRTSRAFEQAGVAHRLDVVPGPHDYAFNRGPGVYEMLLFHDRALRP